jgi:hypothetical protein
MARLTASDPVQATLLAILAQLHPGKARRGSGPTPALELAEIEERLAGFEPVRGGRVDVPLALGLLVRRGLVRAESTGVGFWPPWMAPHQLYEITPEGKAYLSDALPVAPPAC